MANRRDNIGSRSMGRGYGRGYDRSLGYGSSVNPWQTGTIPGMRGDYSSDRGLGPISSLMSAPNSYSQVNNNDQWTLANNLISLLRSGNPQVPSLLDMNPQPMMRNRSMMPMGPTHNRFDERNARRLQPYKMNRGNLSSNRNRPQDQGNRNNSANRNNTSPNKPRRDNRNKNQSLVGNTTKVGPAKKNKPVQNSPGKKAAKRDDSETEVEKKRDWKDEKELGEAGDTKEVEDKVVKTVKKKPVKISPFGGLSSDYLYCHICKKNMWDGISFENHLKGRAHLLMMEGVIEGYRIKCDLIRQECKIIEKAKEIELNRQKWSGKKHVNTHHEYCTMCDLNFVGQLSVHRRSEGHQKLKKFLHPKCLDCNKEFPTRSEWDDHLLCASHLKKVAEKGKASGKGAKKRQVDFKLRTEADEMEDIMQVDADNSAEPDKIESESEKKVTDETEGKASADDVIDSNDLATSTADVNKEENAKVDESTVSDCILEYTEELDLLDIKSRLPKYSSKQSVGTGFITELKCYECKLCSRYFETEPASKIHARSSIHHENFVKMLRSKSDELKSLAKKRAAAEEEEENNAKRRKIAEESQDVDDTEKIENKVADGDDKYDPAEVLDEDELLQEEQSEDKDDVKDDTIWDEVCEKNDDILETAKEEEGEEVVQKEHDEVQIVEETNIKQDEEEEKKPAPEVLAEAFVVLDEVGLADAISPTKTTPRGGRARRGSQRGKGSARGKF